jgi:TonB family protein
MGYMSSSVRVKALPLVLQRFAQDPIALSAIVSLALHLPLLLLLPRLFSSTPGLEEPELPSSIDVVELTTAEQQRVPNFQTPEIILPPLAQTPSSLSTTPLPQASLPSSQTTLPPLPSLNTPSSSLWGFGSSLPTLPPIGNTDPSTFAVPRTQAPIIPPLPSRLPTQPSTVQPPTIQSPTAQSPTPQFPTTQSPTPTTLASPLPPQSIPLPEPVTPSESAPLPVQRSQAQVNQELLARNQEMRNKLTYNESGTGADDFSQEQKWAEIGQAWLGGDRPITGSIQKGEMNGNYPNAAGYRNLSGAAIVAVLVDETGKPAPSPTILQSSGYGVFDEMALQDVMSYKFTATGKKETYWIRVLYAPDRAA